MNDDDMLTAVRDCLSAARGRVAGEQLARPAGAIISRARRRRLRQGLSTVGGAMIVAVAAFALLLPGGGGDGTTSVRLTAWTVTHKSGGLISVTIRELRDPAGLQRRLRADGVPATVRFQVLIPGTPYPRKLPHPCFYHAPAHRQTRLLSRIFPVRTSASDQVVFTINPAAIPAGIGLWMQVSPPEGGRDRGVQFVIWSELDYASGRCPSGKGSGPVSSGFASVPSHK